MSSSASSSRRPLKRKQPPTTAPSNKRHRYQSLSAQTAAIQIKPALAAATKPDYADDDDPNPFHTRLQDLREQNLALGFQAFERAMRGKSESLEMVVHWRKEIVDAVVRGLEKGEGDESWRGWLGILDLVPPLARTLSALLHPFLPTLLPVLLRLPTSSTAKQVPALLEKAYSTTAALLGLLSRELAKGDGQSALDTWEVVRPFLADGGDAARWVAEGWAGLVRRCRGEVAERMIGRMLEGAEEDERLCPGVATVLAECMKSVNQTLHSRAAATLSHLLTFAFASPTSSARSTILTRTLIAVLHHVRKSELFAPAAEVVAGALGAEAERWKTGEKEQDVERLGVTLRVAQICLGVRKGVRVQDKIRQQILQHIHALLFLPAAFASPASPELLRLLATGLVVGKLEDWLSPGVQILEAVFASGRPEEVLAFCSALSELRWSGIEQFMLPPLSRTTYHQNPALHRPLFSLLSSLAARGQFPAPRSAGVERVKSWLGAISTAVDEDAQSSVRRLVEKEERDEADVFFLSRLPPLLSALPTPPPHLPAELSALFAHLLTSTPRDDFFATPANEVFLLSTTITLLDRFGRAEEVRSRADEIVQRWGAYPPVLQAITALFEGSKSAVSPDALAVLRRNLLSHSSALRLASLSLLAASSASDLYAKCLDVEQTPLTVQSSRDRSMRLRRVGQALNLADVAESERESGTGFLIAQLKVNFRPLWAEAITSLSGLFESHQDPTWAAVFAELEKATRGEAAPPKPSWAALAEGRLAEGSRPRGSEYDTDDPTFRCTNLEKWDAVLGRAFEGEAGNLREAVKAQLSTDRLDVVNYEAQLLSALCEVPSVAEKNSRVLVPLFLHFARPSLDELADEGEERQSQRMIRARLSSWLTLFIKFVNPKALFRSDELHALWLELLAKGDSGVQKLALECLLTWKDPALAPYADNLRALLDDAMFRDELTTITLGIESEVIQPDHRAAVLPIVIRILYGLMISRKGRNSASGSGPQARKNAILAALSGCLSEELETLVQLMTAPFEDIINAQAQAKSFALRDLEDPPAGKKQLGFFSLLGDVLRHLGKLIVPHWPVLLGITLQLVHDAQRHIAKAREEQQDEDEAAAAAEAEPTQKHVPYHSVRLLGLKRFGDFFRQPVTYDFTRYLPAAFESFISPRLPLLDRENTQAPSSLLELFALWSEKPETVRFLVDYNERLLAKVYDILTAPAVKPSVISRVFDIVEHILAAATLEGETSEVRDKVVRPYVQPLLVNVANLVEANGGAKAASAKEDLVKRQIMILSEIAAFVEDPEQSARLLSLLAPLVRKPTKVVPERVKSDLLRIFRNLLPLVPAFSDPASDFFQHNLNLFSTLFATLRSHQARVELVGAFKAFGAADPSLARAADLVAELNAFSARRIAEPDFDRRLSAFSKLNEELANDLTLREWIPLLYNMLFFVQDPEELSIRTSASLAMRRFVHLVATRKDEAYTSTLMRMLYPGVRKGLRSRIELVRTELLSVIAAAVEEVDLPVFVDMRCLLAGGDVEANFFNNIHHIQVHRRSRALRRLADQCAEGNLASETLAGVFVPVIGHFLSGTTEQCDHNLINDALAALGHVAGRLKWSAYNALVRQYLKLAKEKTASEKVYVRATMSVLDHFHFAMEEEVVLEQAPAADEEGDDEAAEEPEVNVAAAAAAAQPSQAAKIADVVINRLLPTLMSYLEQKDETEDTIRIPIAAGYVRVALNLPEDQRELQVTRLITALSQILRSKDSDTRNLARETLCKIAVTLGPDFLPIMTRELRAALQRGPQLHVLSFTVHSLLVHLIESDAAKYGNLDDVVADVVHVSTETIFGESAKDAANEEYRSKTREVRSAKTKSLDSFQIVARLVSPSKMASVLLPLRDVMQQTESPKMMAGIDEVLRRVTMGINANTSFTPADILNLCHTLVSQNAQFLKPAPRKGPKKKDVSTGALVQLKREVAKQEDHFAVNAHRFVAFGLDLFVTAFRRAKFDFRDPAMMARLEPMVAVVGNTLYAGEAQVVVLGLKATAALVKAPLKSLARSLPVYVKQIFAILEDAAGTGTETAQTALKALAVLIRDADGAEIKEQQLTYLLELMAPDLEDHDRQATLFSLLRAIVSRKLIVPEVYDLIERVAEIMVTNQSAHVRELCRVVYLQFLLDYPQGKGRLKKQMSFLAQNLSYVHESGRLSVMELLSAILNKFGVELVREYSNLLFVSLVMVLANDDSAKCREVAASLVKALFSILAKEQRDAMLAMLHAWSEQEEQPQLARLSAQVSGLVVDVMEKDAAPFVGTLFADLGAVLARSSEALAALEESVENSMFAPEDAEDVLNWQLSYHVLNALSKVLKLFPNNVRSTSWADVKAHLLFPHAWVRMQACRLLGTLFASVPVAAPRPDLPSSDPLSLPFLLDIARKLSLQLRSENVDDALGLQIVKNLFYIGKCFALVALRAGSSATVVDGEDLEDAEGSEDEEGGDDAAKSEQNPLAWIFSRLSHQARSAHAHRPPLHAVTTRWSQEPSSVFRWFAAMITHLDAPAITPFLTHILTPLYRVLDDDTPKDTQLEELKTLAHEVQDLLQEKIGTTAFSQAYNAVRQRTLEVRRERKAARAQQAAMNPEAAAKRKAQRNDMKKASKKRKSAAHADMKTRNLGGRAGKRRKEE